MYFYYNFRIPAFHKKRSVMSTPPSPQKLQRIFSLVPLVYSKQGIELHKLQELAGFESPEELLHSLGRLMMFGAPPFSPSDFISVHVDDRERVWLDFPLGLERPLALSSAEWTAIQKLIRKELEFVAQEDPISESLRELLARLGDVPIAFETDEQFLSQRNIIREALADKLQLEFLYRTLSSKEPELRRVDPWLLFKNNGLSYLIAYCHTRAAARCFLLERMQNLELLEWQQEKLAPKNINEYLENSPLFQKEPKGFNIKIAFTPELLANLRLLFHLHNIKPYEIKKQKGKSGRLGKASDRERQNPKTENSKVQWLTAQCKIQDSIWLRSVLRSLGTEIILLEPTHLRESYLNELATLPIPQAF